MKKLLLTVALVSTALLTDSNATSVTWGPAPTARAVITSSAALAPTTSLVWAGTFASEVFAFNPLISVAANVSAITIAGGWEQFTLDTSTSALNAGATSTLTINGTGKVGGTITDDNFGATKADFFNGDPIYLWIFNASTVAAATEMGIFRATVGSPAWTFPTNAGGVGDSVALGTSTAAAATMVAVGGAGTATSSNLQLASAVPEPSSAMLVAAGVLGLLARRRRVRSA